MIGVVECVLCELWRWNPSEWRKGETRSYVSELASLPDHPTQLKLHHARGYRESLVRFDAIPVSYSCSYTPTTPGCSAKQASDVPRPRRCLPLTPSRATRKVRRCPSKPQRQQQWQLA